MNNKYNSLPMLRFPEFSGEWTQYKLGECFDERNEQFPESSDYPLMAFIAGKGVTEKGEKYDRSALVKDAPNKKYKRTELGDFIYSSNNLESGSIGLNRYGKACISPVYSIFKAKKGFDPYFIGTILTQKSFISEMIKYRQGVVYGQWKIPEKEFLNLIIRIPSFGEQQRIAEFLEAEDRMIAAQEQKVESLKAHKKGLMQQFFPQPGATTPALRFPGFTGDWQEKSFDGICHTITPPLKLQSSQYSSSGKFPIVDQSQTLICGWTNDSSGLLRNTPYIIFGDHTCVLKYIDFPFIQGADGVKILGSNKKDNSKFIYQLLLSNPVKQDGYKRHFSDLKEKIFLLPPTLEEQTKIAECLSSIDEIIFVEESKVAFLKSHKKGLMQQLFPQPEK